ncbi:MAG: hypothetical protein ACKVP3_17320 [Hyphomicrobiaceae bacterium]
MQVRAVGDGQNGVNACTSRHDDSWVNFPPISAPALVPRETARAFVIWFAPGHQLTREGLAMSIETLALAVVVFGAAAVVIIISLVLAKFDDEARRIVHDKRQRHYGGDAE